MFLFQHKFFNTRSYGPDNDGAYSQYLLVYVCIHAEAIRGCCAPAM
jgi:hypothetical protein